MKSLPWFLLFTLATVLPLTAEERVDLDTVYRIRNAAFRDSQVMNLAQTLTDRYGFRLTGSPSLDEAAAWVRTQLESWGLQNAQLEPWTPFGRGWENELVSVRMTAPIQAPLYAIPLAWTQGTEGIVTAEVMRAPLESEKEFEALRGTLEGKILLIGEAPELAPHIEPEFERFDELALQEITSYRIPAERDEERRERFRKRREFREALNKFLIEEKALAVIQAGSGGDGGSFRVGSFGSYEKDKPLGIPALAMAPEHWGRIERLLEDEETVTLELDVRNRIIDDRAAEHNVIAEIPGTDRYGEIVMMGAHLDAWHSGTGATDNAAGVAAVMEAARILNSLGVRPKRTIRIALWTGEEQGLLGSRRYVEEHFATWPEPQDESQKDLSPWNRTDRPVPALKPEQRKVSAYFNLDNGTGKVRGIYAQENLAVIPIFQKWLEPFHDLGATTVSPRNTTGTDHLPIDAAGIPAFQFIQDEIEYDSRTHHTNWDVYERLQREDLMQASAVMAFFVWQAANRPEMLPRKPLK